MFQTKINRREAPYYNESILKEQSLDFNFKNGHFLVFTMCLLAIHLTKRVKRSNIKRSSSVRVIKSNSPDKVFSRCPVYNCFLQILDNSSVKKNTPYSSSKNVLNNEVYSRITTISLNFNKAPIELRESLAINSNDWGKIAKLITDLPSIKGAAIMSTCNRFDVYITHNDRDSALKEVFGFLRERANLNIDLQEYFTIHHDTDSLLYLMRLASGLESKILGEHQIQSQIKSCINNSTAADRTILKFLHEALEAGKEVRKTTRIGQGSVGIANIAVQQLVTTDPSLLRNGIVTIRGSGTIAKLLIHSLLGNKICRPKKIYVISSDTERCTAWLDSIISDSSYRKNLVAVPISETINTIANSDVVFIATHTEQIKSSQNIPRSNSNRPAQLYQEKELGIDKFTVKNTPNNLIDFDEHSKSNNRNANFIAKNKTSHELSSQGVTAQSFTEFVQSLNNHSFKNNTKYFNNSIYTEPNTANTSLNQLNSKTKSFKVKNKASNSDLVLNSNSKDIDFIKNHTSNNFDISSANKNNYNTCAVEVLDSDNFSSQNSENRGLYRLKNIPTIHPAQNSSHRTDSSFVNESKSEASRSLSRSSLRDYMLEYDYRNHEKNKIGFIKERERQYSSSKCICLESESQENKSISIEKTNKYNFTDLSCKSSGSDNIHHNRNVMKDKSQTILPKGEDILIYNDKYSCGFQPFTITENDSFERYSQSKSAQFINQANKSKDTYSFSDKSYLPLQTKYKAINKSVKPMFAYSNNFLNRLSKETNVDVENSDHLPSMSLRDVNEIQNYKYIGHKNNLQYFRTGRNNFFDVQPNTEYSSNKSYLKFVESKSIKKVTNITSSSTCRCVSSTYSSKRSTKIKKFRANCRVHSCPCKWCPTRSWVQHRPQIKHSHMRNKYIGNSFVALLATILLFKNYRNKKNESFLKFPVHLLAPSKYRNTKYRQTKCKRICRLITKGDTVSRHVNAIHQCNSLVVCSYNCAQYI